MAGRTLGDGALSRAKVGSRDRPPRVHGVLRGRRRDPGAAADDVISYWDSGMRDRAANATRMARSDSPSRSRETRSGVVT